MMRGDAGATNPRNTRPVAEECRFNSDSPAKLICALLLLLVAVACTPRPKPAAPAPPPIQTEVAKPRHVKAGPNDREVNGCVPTKLNKDGSVNCLCSAMSTKIDSATGGMSVECKTLAPRKEGKRAKH